MKKKMNNWKIIIWLKLKIVKIWVYKVDGLKKSIHFLYQQWIFMVKTGKKLKKLLKLEVVLKFDHMLKNFLND